MWSPIISDTSLNKLQTIQNTALRTITGYTKDTNLHHLHTETKILPIDYHLKLHASLTKQKTKSPTKAILTHSVTTSTEANETNNHSQPQLHPQPTDYTQKHNSRSHDTIKQNTPLFKHNLITWHQI
ncbi:UNVERIFIED_CONTAM: hypothetical protein GTU68_011337 [Idotea baltica]|nr:hypothetical protein [Idotea baltica]